MRNGPPSSGQQVRTGRRSRRTSVLHDLRDRARGGCRRVPTRAASREHVARLPELAGVGGRRVCASSASRRTRRSGRRPKASSARARVPKRFVTSGKSAPRTFVKRSAGPPAAITRRWISAASRRASTGRLDDGEVASGGAGRRGTRAGRGRSRRSCAGRLFPIAPAVTKTLGGGVRRIICAPRGRGHAEVTRARPLVLRLLRRLRASAPALPGGVAAPGHGAASA